MAGKGAGARQLTLSDVRDYLIDTDAVKEAEKLLLSAKVGSHGSEDNTSKAKRDLERQRENATDVIRQRYKTGPREKREGVLDKLVVEKQHGKLGLLREEEEMRELLALEQLLRDESVTIERERMKVASETQNAKRSQILKFEKEAEQDLLQLETQRSNGKSVLCQMRMCCTILCCIVLYCTVRYGI